MFVVGVTVVVGVSVVVIGDSVVVVVDAVVVVSAVVGVCVVSKCPVSPSSVTIMRPAKDGAITSVYGNSPTVTNV